MFLNAQFKGPLMQLVCEDGELFAFLCAAFVLQDAGFAGINTLSIS